MYNHEDEKAPTVTDIINRIAKSTECIYRADNDVKQAFMLGLWYKFFPLYMMQHLERCYNWHIKDIDPANANNYSIEQVYPHLMRFQFTAETGDSWHQCYRDLRSRGWNRFKVWREGGRLQYLFEIKQADKPEGYQELWLLLDISIATCKQVQVGTQMVEQPIWETKCDDLSELPEDAPSAEVVPLVVIDDIEELQRRRDGQHDARDPDTDTIPF